MGRLTTIKKPHLRYTSEVIAIKKKNLKRLLGFRKSKLFKQN